MQGFIPLASVLLVAGRLFLACVMMKCRKGSMGNGIGGLTAQTKDVKIMKERVFFKTRLNGLRRTNEV